MAEGGGGVSPDTQITMVLGAAGEKVAQTPSPGWVVPDTVPWQLGLEKDAIMARELLVAEQKTLKEPPPPVAAHVLLPAL